MTPVHEPGQDGRLDRRRRRSGIHAKPVDYEYVRA